jgi:hypothetical protein
MTRYAIFLEPQAELRMQIVALKQKVEGTLPGQTYCAHPPHCTLLFGAYLQPSLWLDELQSSLDDFPSFILKTQGFHVFYDDLPAGGGHTVVIKVVDTPALHRLQLSVGALLAGHKDSQPDSVEPLPFLQRDPFRASFERYGFPFVGEHWLPHFSIASLKVEKDAVLLKEMLKSRASYAFLTQEISIWQVDGDLHTKLHTIHLGAN